jgi:RNA polymerase sigma-70 factor (ECF subfamily)
VDPARSFVTTHWSAVLQAAHESTPAAREALEHLCKAYWYPLYVHVRRVGWSPADAQDLTQEFFARLIERRSLRLADPDRGRFRSFLLTALKHFLADEWDRLRAQKRGGDREFLSWDGLAAEERYQLEPQDPGSPERAYERRWAGMVLANALSRLEREYQRTGRLTEFNELKGFVWGAGAQGGYADVGARLGATEGAIKVAVHRLRTRFREALRHEVLQTVSSADEVDAELTHLRSLLSD